MSTPALKAARSPATGAEIDILVRRIATIRGVHNYAPGHLLRAVDFLADHHRDFPFADLVAQWFPLDRTDEAFAAARDASRIRVGVRSGQ